MKLKQAACSLDLKPMRYYRTSHEQLREHLNTLTDAYNFAKRLTTLRATNPFRVRQQLLGEETRTVL